MLISLALIFLVGFSFAAIFKALKLPRIIGMLLTGVLLGPYVLNMLDSSILGISADLRQMALVIILIKAWLGALIMIFIGLYCVFYDSFIFYLKQKMSYNQLILAEKEGFEPSLPLRTLTV